jgi:hypothetical protein
MKRLRGQNNFSTVFESSWNYCERAGCLRYRETFSVALDSYLGFNEY